MKTGWILINLGTPRSPEESDVRDYLREFLSDPYVIDIPAPARWLLLNLIILPRRPALSGKAYEKVWTERGSPLLFHSQDLVERLREKKSAPIVALAMRYGQPSIREALEALRAQGIQRLGILPLYPQYSLAATESSLRKVEDELKAMDWRLDGGTFSIRDFCDDPHFIEASVEVARPWIALHEPDYVLMSFHGIPERHVRKTDPSRRYCLESSHCCDVQVPENALCYRAQCFRTARALAAALKLSESRYSVSFQSRLGRTPWIQPFTDHVLPVLARQGVRKLMVLCPSFVADCLETLEEIAIRARADFQRMGGEDLYLVPSLNSHEAWVKAVNRLMRDPQDEIR